MQNRFWSQFVFHNRGTIERPSIPKRLRRSTRKRKDKPMIYVESISSLIEVIPICFLPILSCRCTFYVSLDHWLVRDIKMPHRIICTADIRKIIWGLMSFFCEYFFRRSYHSLLLLNRWILHVVVIRSLSITFVRLCLSCVIIHYDT